MNIHVPAASSAPNLGMQVTTFENPMGIDGFEFVEFAAPAGQAAQLHGYFRNLGFTAVARHRQRAITLYRQGGVNFLVNEAPDSFAADFAAKHGPSACGFAIRFARSADQVLATALGNGAEEVSFKTDSRAVPAPVMLVNSGADTVVSRLAIETMARRLRNPAYVLIHGARHEVMMEREVYAAQFWAAFDAFIPGSSE